MSGAFYDTFTTTQGVTGPGSSNIPYNGTWSPNSSRTLLTNTSFAFVGITGGHMTMPGGAQAGITYPGFSPQNLSSLSTVNFSNSFANAANINLTISVSASNGTISRTIGGTTAVFLTAYTSQDITVPITNTDNVLSNAVSISINFLTTGFYSNTITIGAFTSIFTCVAHNSNILTPLGYKSIQDLQRGDEIVGGKIAKIIRTKLLPQQIVEAVSFAPSSLEFNIPDKETIVCSEHYFIYKNKRRLAKCFLGYPGVKLIKSRAEEILPTDKEGKIYFYDIQFDCEGEYIVNGLISQSRSPYASVSPLPEELYFDEKNYREERVLNTLRHEPEISTKYLLPNGEEVETFYKILSRS